MCELGRLTPAWMEEASFAHQPGAFVTLDPTTTASPPYCLLHDYTSNLRFWRLPDPPRADLAATLHFAFRHGITSPAAPISPSAATRRIAKYQVPVTTTTSPYTSSVPAGDMYDF